MVQNNDSTVVIDPHSVEPPNMSNAHLQNLQSLDSPSHKLMNTVTSDAKSEYITAAPIVSTVPPTSPGINISSGGSVVGVGVGGSSTGSVVGMHTANSATTTEQQLRYENERLKLALAQRYEISELNIF